MNFKKFKDVKVHTFNFNNKGIHFFKFFFLLCVGLLPMGVFVQPFKI